MRNSHQIGAAALLATLSMTGCGSANGRSESKTLDSVPVGAPVRPLKAAGEVLSLRNSFSISPASLTSSGVSFSTPRSWPSLDCFVTLPTPSTMQRIVRTDGCYVLPPDFAVPINSDDYFVVPLLNFPGMTQTDFELKCKTHVSIKSDYDKVDFASFLFTYRDYPNLGYQTAPSQRCTTPGSPVPVGSGGYWICSARAHNALTGANYAVAGSGINYTDAFKSLQDQCSNVTCSAPQCEQH